MHSERYLRLFVAEPPQVPQEVATMNSRFDWRMTHRTRHVRIEKVLYQPEAAGHFHL